MCSQRFSHNNVYNLENWCDNLLYFAFVRVDDETIVYETNSTRFINNNEGEEKRVVESIYTENRAFEMHAVYTHPISRNITDIQATSSVSLHSINQRGLLHWKNYLLLLLLPLWLLFWRFRVH